MTNYTNEILLSEAREKSFDNELALLLSSISDKTSYTNKKSLFSTKEDLILNPSIKECFSVCKALFESRKNLDITEQAFISEIETKYDNGKTDFSAAEMVEVLKIKLSSEFALSDKANFRKAQESVKIIEENYNNLILNLKLEEISNNSKLSVSEKAKALEELSTEFNKKSVKAKYSSPEEYINSVSNANYLQAFIDQTMQDVPAIKTGYTTFDEVMDGGLYAGLYVIGAISSLGKTTYILQMADQIAEQGQDVLIFALEMSRNELIAKSISRQTYHIVKSNKTKYKDNYIKTVRGITDKKRYMHYNFEERSVITEAEKNYYNNISKNIFVFEGNGDIGVEDIEKIVNEHIEITNRKPVVIVDYLQILKPYNPKSNDKQNTDIAVMKLKILSRENNIPVIAISSFNRDNYKVGVHMGSFKESGAIEYSSDVLMGLQLKGVEKANFNVEEAKKQEVREIELKILKNRNGRTGDKIAYDYEPKFNIFTENGIVEDEDE